MAIHVPDVGVRHVLLGDPSTALGADMVALGVARNVTVTRTPRTKVGSTVTGNENHEYIGALGVDCQVTFEVPRSVSNDVRDYMAGFVDTNGDYVALGASLEKVTLCLIHPDDAASETAGASAKTRWFPSVRLTDVGDENYNANNDGIDDSDFVQLTFQAGYIATDQNGDDVPEAALPDFHGDRLVTHGMSYVLPTPYGPAV